MESFDVFNLRFRVLGLPIGTLSQLLDHAGIPSARRAASVEEGGSFRFAPVGDGYDLRWGNTLVAEAQPLALLAELVRAKVHQAVQARHKDLLFLRGDVVHWPGAGAIALLGRSFVGKTRLAQALVGAGATPWSEFFAVIDPEGKFLRYPDPELSQGLAPAALGAVRFGPDCADWKPELLTPGLATLQLVAGLKLERERMSEVVARVSKVCLNARLLFQGERGNPAAVVRFLEQSLRAPSSPSPI